ncbi:MAG TPA: glycosyltransferase family 4 protein [Solirubrobacteraceae bacterium]|jgi:glycosyltransferase involved in cell wall biosynthesis|nr:glycosyltransferase family 4 protein [Solirubrobacteraceae bacterium]
MVLFLHSRYRVTGGEERVVGDMAWLVREHLREPVELMMRDSAALGRGRAASGLLWGGLEPEQVAARVRASGARIVHAHNLNPTLGWRALKAARNAGAAVVLHLHQYRLVCANGVCFTGGEQCTRCHGRNTLPGVLRNCRNSRMEALTYGAGLALWQAKLVEQAHAVVVPSEFARERLRELGAPLPWQRVHVLSPPLRAFAETSRAINGKHALVVSRLAPEKGVDVAIEACREVGKPLVVAGDGPELPRLRALAADGDVTFTGHVQDERLAQLRGEAAVALIPSRSAETFGMAAAEAMAAGIPVVASAVGGLTELLGGQGAAPPGDVAQFAHAVARLWADAEAGQRGLERVRGLCAPAVVAEGLEQVYAQAASVSPR